MNCLVTNYKAEIEDANNNFPYFDKVRLQSNNQSAYIILRGSYRITSDVVTEVVINNNVQSLPIVMSGSIGDTIRPKDGDDFDIYISGGITFIESHYCKIKGNYLSLRQLANLGELSVYGTNTAVGHDVDFSTDMLIENLSITKLYVNDYNLEGSLENLKDSAIIDIQGGFNRCSGDIALLDKNGLTRISMAGAQSIYGDIESFGDNLTVTDLYFTSSPNVYGDINKLAQALVANGKTSGTLKVLVSGTQCTNSYSGTLSNPLRVLITFSGGGYTMAGA